MVPEHDKDLCELFGFWSRGKYFNEELLTELVERKMVVPFTEEGLQFLKKPRGVSAKIMAKAIAKTFVGRSYVNLGTER